MSELATRPAAPFGAWERMLAGRYLRAKRSEGGVALISIISFVGIMIAVAVLIIVMSVMNGFRSELLGRILGFNGHLFVSGGVLDRPDRDAVVRQITKVPGVVQAAPIIEAQAIAISISGRPMPLRRQRGSNQAAENQARPGTREQRKLLAVPQGSPAGSRTT